MGDGDNSHILSLASVGRGVVFYTFGKLTDQLLGFASVVILTRALGPEKYGVYTFAFTIISLVAVFASLGADQANLRFLPANPSEQSDYWSFSVILAVLGSLVAGSLIFVTAPLINDLTMDNSLLVGTLQAFAFFLVAKIGLKLSQTAFRGLDRPDLNTFVHQVLYPFAKVVVFLAISLFTHEYFSFVLGTVAATAIVAVFGIGVLFVKTPIRGKRPRAVSPRQYLDFSVPSAIKDVGTLLYTRADILMLGYLASASGVGIYKIAVLLATTISLPLFSVNQIFPSIASELYSDDETEDLEKVYRTVTRWTITAALPVSLVVLVYRYEILRLLGSEFQEGALILTVLVVGQFANAAVGPSGYLLLMTDKQRLVTVNQWSFGLFNVVLNYVLITRVGVVGAAIGTTVTLAVLSLVRLGEVVVLEGWFPYTSRLSKPLVAGLGMLIVLVGVQSVATGLVALLVGGALGALTFLAVLYRFGISDIDWMVFDEIRKSF